MTTLQGFDANQVEPNVRPEAIPAGKYAAVIVASDSKPTKNRDGQYLELEFEIIEGQFKGRKLWDRLVLDHPNPLTVKIARGTLSAICRSVGVMTPSDSSELHNIPLTISVRCKKHNDEVVNEIRGYSKREEAQGKPIQATTNTPPWHRQPKEGVPF